MKGYRLFDSLDRLLVSFSKRSLFFLKLNLKVNAIGFGFKSINWPIVFFLRSYGPGVLIFSPLFAFVKVKSLFTRSTWSDSESLFCCWQTIEMKRRKKRAFKEEIDHWLCSTITVVKIRDRELFSRPSTSESWENRSVSTYLLVAFPSWGTFSIYNIDTDSDDADQSDSCDSPDMSTLSFVEPNAWRTICSL